MSSTLFWPAAVFAYTCLLQVCSAYCWGRIGCTPRSFEYLLKQVSCAAQIMRDLADGKMPSGFDNGDMFREVAAALMLPVDVEETQSAFVYTADVPGLEKGDLKACLPACPFSCSFTCVIWEVTSAWCASVCEDF